MWERRLRSKMLFMTSLLTQPMATAQQDAVVRAGFLRRRRSGK
jgi:hypothetical protein